MSHLIALVIDSTGGGVVNVTTGLSVYLLTMNANIHTRTNS